MSLKQDVTSVVRVMDRVVFGAVFLCMSSMLVQAQDPGTDAAMQAVQQSTQIATQAAQQATQQANQAAQQANQQASQDAQNAAASSGPFPQRENTPPPQWLQFRSAHQMPKFFTPLMEVIRLSLLPHIPARFRSVPPVV